MPVSARSSASLSRIVFLFPLTFALVACESDEPSGPGNPPQARGLAGCWENFRSEKNHSRLTITAPDSLVLTNNFVDTTAKECSMEVVGGLRTTWRDAGDSLVLGAGIWKHESRCGNESLPSLDIQGVETPLAYELREGDTLLLEVPSPWYPSSPDFSGRVWKTYTRCPDA